MPAGGWPLQWAMAAPLLLFAAASPAEQSVVMPDLAQRLERHVRTLTSIQPPRNFAHPAGLEKAATYIESELQAVGWPVASQPYAVNGNRYRNLRALRGPADAERVVVGAHYDVHGDLPGADDNASAVAIMLEVARELGDFEPALGLELVAFTLEEHPAFSMGVMGSGVHAASLREQGVELRLMLALEMLGYYVDTPGSQRFPLPGLSWWYPDRGNFVALIGRFAEFFSLRKVAGAMRKTGGVPMHYLASPVAFDGISRSDHRNYWEAGYPAIMVTDSAFYRNPHYHQPTDTADTLDYRRMAQLVPQIAAAVRALCRPE